MTSQRTRDRLVERLREKGIRNEKVLDVIGNTPRHLFVDEALASRAYEDTALPIGYNQTISQPYIVAVMTDLVTRNNPRKVLEIGTGSGYQAAVLAPLVEKVYTVERIEPLATQARQRFRKLGIRNVRASYTDGTEGLPEFAPYDAIITTAAAEEIPDALLEQLSPEGGRLIIPVGSRTRQTLMLVTRNDNIFEHEELDPVIFVPLLTGQT
ncbi:MAG: protein-L-isoaspartate(D-aspartate) O-methyltransferase [Gammaproteobacteria bacterium]|jgi:protein-L-isoaspartate(D-aspartate) O-methyltransferase|nr:protein-L-isoaspartate(D-aspartate) O-methyltransferase [Gammaproteobacteria bacterium]MDH5515497.1 protein-L-isoaspartate(D-aspartate) O-methyltransferase [Gammaproteobacteria bacterium]HSG11754.1 protein-L-isoaspartate(D-aspartate) O-methyltransferase [Gammaproteobacteria bacterium]